MNIQARENDDSIILQEPGAQNWRRIQDEDQDEVSLNSRFWSNSDLKAQPMFYFPVPSGSWSVDITCEGYQPTSDPTQQGAYRSDGFIAYSEIDNDNLWNVGQTGSLKISNLKGMNTKKAGHPKLVVNGCSFNNGQVMERDATISFHVDTDRDSNFFLTGPSVQKQGKYNYTVSYGEWTIRELEFGLITVVLDEHLENTGSRRFSRPVRNGHQLASRVTETVKEYTVSDKTGERPTSPETKPSHELFEDQYIPDSPPGRPPLIVDSPDYLDINPGIPDAPDDFQWDIPRSEAPQPDTRSTRSSLAGGSITGGTLKKGTARRTVSDFQPTTPFLQAWDPEHFNLPSMSGANMQNMANRLRLPPDQVRELQEQIDAKTQKQRKSWLSRK